MEGGGCLVAQYGPYGAPLAPPGCLLGRKSSSKSFVAFGLRLVLIFCEVKNKQKITTDAGHYVNWLVPKNDIKLLQNEYKTSKNDNITTWNNKKL